ncbi:carboxylesterase [Renibacterium salmoninarum ATCC 33209]|uniref:Carboxylesterase n=1 Tax=Renibacterium salmoninarum (strain ATCC 33209 / DSM 20767 / JCM 11484 / NBRC 15589 / NCIMB 2235) TaxID=288705 RepID=A9WQT8_RENSM|nr:carboxylesterase family protein [Renibacterium salmoninarum]ABY23667.1 carboxylesterase [Renibacterium salmoninarum ATCC 33209]
MRILGVERGANLGKELRELPAERLLSAYSKLAMDRAVPGQIAPPMYPVFGGPGMPLARDKALQEGLLDGKELLIGCTRDEMTAFLNFDERLQSLDREMVLNLLATRAGESAQDSYRSYEAQHATATPLQILAEVGTGLYFRNGMMALADHPSKSRRKTFIYQWDFVPEPDVANLGATHCGELPFLFGTFSSYQSSPMLGQQNGRTEKLWQSFAGALAAFVSSGAPQGGGLPYWPKYAANPGVQIRHFS